MNLLEIRKKFLDFFALQGHTVVPSSSLIPAQDPTILFANAGMNQFKDIFLGKEKRTYTRATTCQKCVRAGGKHNDLDQVGYTARHLTFFEMLGNFSFGDYFKKEAIQFAWDLLTREFKLPSEKLYVTVYKTDDEAYDLWRTMIGVPSDHISRLGEKDNFWQMGDIGPCGPCTEIYVDRGAHRGCGSSACAPGCDCSRYTEIWNLVFMQYSRQADGTLIPLESKGVDTGMGLERLCMVLQDKDTVFHIDAFLSLIKHIEVFSKMSYDRSDENLQAAFHVVAEHVRAASLLIADGCSPANDGRGYVLRKIIRRAALFAQKLSSDNRLFSHVAEAFISEMKDIYPELETNKKLIISILDNEVDRFAANLIQGQAILQRYTTDMVAAGRESLSGDLVFKLYDTYGFPYELTGLIAKEKGLSIDKKGFDVCMQRQQEQSGKKGLAAGEQFQFPAGISTNYVGDVELVSEANIMFAQENPDGSWWIVTDRSPFYVECGGQVGDVGFVEIGRERFNVVSLQKVGDNHAPAIALKIVSAKEHAAPVDINVGIAIRCIVDADIRSAIARNHTATHLLQAALINVLGKQVKQAGSLVNDVHLRFDFTHDQALTQTEIEHIELLVNGYILNDIPTNIYETTLDEARDKGALSFFGEKYNPERVRVVHVTDVSKELCGGSHVARTGYIGSFKILSESSLATGTRRIIAVTGVESIRLFQRSFGVIKQLGEEFKVKFEEVLPAIFKLQENSQQLQSTIKQLKKQLFTVRVHELATSISNIAGIPYCYGQFDGAMGDDLRQVCSDLEKKTPGFYVLVGVDLQQQRTTLVGYVAKEYVSTVDLKQFSLFLREKFGIKGGGSTTMIQGGCAGVPEGFKQHIEDWLRGR